jgi:hypothetical protein
MPSNHSRLRRRGPGQEQRLQQTRLGRSLLRRRYLADAVQVRIFHSTRPASKAGLLLLVACNIMSQRLWTWRVRTRLALGRTRLCGSGVGARGASVPFPVRSAVRGLVSPSRLLVDLVQCPAVGALVDGVRQLRPQGWRGHSSCAAVRCLRRLSGADSRWQVDGRWMADAASRRKALDVVAWQYIAVGPRLGARRLSLSCGAHEDVTLRQTAVAGHQRIDCYK